MYDCDWSFSVLFVFVDLALSPASVYIGPVKNPGTTLIGVRVHTFELEIQLSRNKDRKRMGGVNTKHQRDKTNN